MFYSRLIMNDEWNKPFTGNVSSTESFFFLLASSYIWNMRIILRKTTLTGTSSLRKTEVRDLLQHMDQKRRSFKTDWYSRKDRLCGCPLRNRPFLLLLPFFFSPSRDIITTSVEGTSWRHRCVQKGRRMDSIHQ